MNAKNKETKTNTGKGEQKKKINECGKKINIKKMKENEKWEKGEGW